MLETLAADLPRTSDRSDAQLVQDTLDGGSEFYAPLVRRYNQRVFRIARGILRSDAEAEDACQDAFLRAYEKLGQLAQPAAFGGWVARIAANMALQRLRRRNKLRAIVERKETDPSMTEQVPTVSPDHDAYRQQLRGILERAIDELPVIYRSVLVMRDVEDMTTEQTADALDLSPVTVRVRLHRARGLMRARLGEELEGVAAAGAFAFDGVRCDRLVTGLFRKLRRETAWHGRTANGARHLHR